METTNTIEIPEKHLPAKIMSVKVKKDQDIEKNTLICLYEFSDSSPDAENYSSFEKNIAELRSPVLGKIQEINITVGQIIDSKSYSVLTIIEPCSHAVQWKGMCSICGKDCSIDDFTGSDVNRATICMTHDAAELLVSKQEAQRLEHETAERLLKQKKLSLILDLDQTIIHATIDPSIGEWKNDPNNPNYEVLKDVYQFTLPDSATIYYIKLRPGLREFLNEISQIFELHIYTMGTRSYANAISKIIDPTSEYFGGRILSRDESGSFALKSIQRLFPCDQSMVVVIDDRADVWCWSENLIKVQPYNFYVGIGDINAPIIQTEEKNEITEENKGNSDKVKDKNKIKDEKKEEILEGSESSKNPNENSEKNQNTTNVNNNLINSSPVLDTNSTKRSLLVDNDKELFIVKNVLKEIHTKFYNNINENGKEKTENISVQNIIREMRHKVLKGKNILFSSVIPLNQDPLSTDIWNLTILFGGTPFNNICPELTHVIARKNGTAKVNKARKIPGIKIVKPEWLLQSIYNWKLQDENNYLLDPDTSNDNSNIFDFIKDENLDDEEEKISDDINNSNNYDNLHDDEKLVNDLITDVPIDLNTFSTDWDDMDMEIDEAIEDSEFGNDVDNLTNDSEIPSDDDDYNIPDPNYNDNENNIDNEKDDINDFDIKDKSNTKVTMKNIDNNGISSFNLDDYKNDEDFKTISNANIKRKKYNDNDDDDLNNDYENEEHIRKKLFRTSSENSSENDDDDDDDDESDNNNNESSENMNQSEDENEESDEINQSIDESEEESENSSETINSDENESTTTDDDDDSDNDNDDDESNDEDNSNDEDDDDEDDDDDDENDDDETNNLEAELEEMVSKNKENDGENSVDTNDSSEEYETNEKERNDDFESDSNDNENEDSEDIESTESTENTDNNESEEIENEEIEEIINDDKNDNNTYNNYNENVDELEESETLDNSITTTNSDDGDDISKGAENEKLDESTNDNLNESNDIE